MYQECAPNENYDSEMSTEFPKMRISCAEMGAKVTPFLQESLFKTDSEGGPKGRAEGRFVAKVGQQCIRNAHRLTTVLRK